MTTAQPSPTMADKVRMAIQSMPKSIYKRVRPEVESEAWKTWSDNRRLSWLVFMDLYVEKGCPAAGIEKFGIDEFEAQWKKMMDRLLEKTRAEFRGKTEAARR